MDLSFKSLATIGILLGALGWFFDDSTPSEASRKPTAIGKGSRNFRKAEAYKPNLNVLNTTRAAEAEVNVVNDGDAQADEIILEEQAHPVNEARAVDTSDFENIRREITQHLTEGNVDSALDFAEKKLEETLKQADTGDNSVSYLHEFIMEHADNPDHEMDVTLTALKGTQNASVRRSILDKFQNHSPNMVDDLNRELDAAGVIVE